MMWAWYVGWPIFSIVLTFVIDHVTYGNWYWNFEGNLYHLWRAR